MLIYDFTFLSFGVIVKILSNIYIKLHLIEIQWTQEASESISSVAFLYIYIFYAIRTLCDFPQLRVSGVLKSVTLTTKDSLVFSEDMSAHIPKD